MLDELAAATPAGSDDLYFTPWLAGERAPVLDHYARGGFLGLSLGHTRAHLTRSVMEGVAFHIRWIIEAMEHVGFRIDAMQAIGGGSASPLWTQIIADVTGRRLNVVEHPLEAGAMGAALAVAVGLGVYPNMDAVDDLIVVNRTVEPHEVDARSTSACTRRSAASTRPWPRSTGRANRTPSGCGRPSDNGGQIFESVSGSGTAIIAGEATGRAC